jgi:monoamine oxidase
MNDSDVVVVGAGLAGLTAARRLRRAGRTVVVLEARDRVGGRTLNHELGEGKVVEIGGQWVGPSQDRVLDLIDELGLSTFPTYDSGEHLFEYRDRVRRYSGRIPRVFSPALADFAFALWRLDRMARTVDPDQPWQAARAADWDAQTVASWSSRHMLTPFGRAALRVICEGVWAADAADVSLLHFLTYAHAAGGLRPLIATAGGAQDRRVVGGSQSIALALADELTGAVRCNEPVREIDHHPGERAVVYTDNSAYRCQHVVVAMNPALCGRLRYDPALPAPRDALTQRCPNGAVIKCMAIYDVPFWRAQGLSGQVTTYRPPVKVVYDNSPPDGTPGVLLAFLEGNQARELALVTPRERQEVVVDCLVRFFGPRARDVVDFVEKDWSDEEFTRGCYGAFFGPNTWTGYGPALRAPVDVLHWAGSETSTVWMGYMDGAIRSGERAAAEILRARADGHDPAATLDEGIAR